MYLCMMLSEKPSELWLVSMLVICASWDLFSSSRVFGVVECGWVLFCCWKVRMSSHVLSGMSIGCGIVSFCGIVVGCDS